MCTAFLSLSEQTKCGEKQKHQEFESEFDALYSVQTVTVMCCFKRGGDTAIMLTRPVWPAVVTTFSPT